MEELNLNKQIAFGLIYGIGEAFACSIPKGQSWYYSWPKENIKKWGLKL